MPVLRSSIGAVLYLHGTGGSGPQGIRTARLRVPFTDAGLIFLAPSGQPGPVGDGEWSLPPALRGGGRDEIAFLKAVLADAADRFGLDPARIVLAGHSRGAGLVYRVACEAPGLAIAYLPLSAGFIGPSPERCAGPVRLLHLHGARDRAVPVAGRTAGLRIAGARESAERLAAASGCGPRPIPTDTPARLSWACPEAASVAVEILPGRHRVTHRMMRRAATWAAAQLPR
ncbi:MAG: alpha/beta hydrolase family esterase [Paracoccaceae bacterium]